MYSIDNSYNAEDLTKWAQRCFEAVDPELAQLDAKLADLDAREAGLKGKRDAESKKSREALASDRAALLQQRIQRLDSKAAEGYPSQTATPRNRRSMGSPRACATRTANSRSVSRAATVRGR